MEQLIRLYLVSMRALLKAAGLPEDAVQHVLEAIFSGSATVERECTALLARRGSGDPSLTAELPALVGALARVTPILARPTVNDEALEAAASVMRDVGDIGLRLDIAPMAYNLFEIAWHLGGIFDRPALDVAERLWAHADPHNVDQYHGAIWRLAIERLRHTFDSASNYLPALDALELALTCYVPTEPIRRDLFERLQAQIKRAQGTPVEDLVGIVAVNVPPGVWDAAKRLAAQQALAALRFGDRALTLHPIEAEIFATTEAQAMLDDLRLKLAPDEEEGAQIDWHDLRYRDSRLASAVPVGLSLIADPARSAVLLLDLAHEVGHALALQGPIGMRQASYRAVINYSEMLLLDLAGRSATTDGTIQSALAVLPNHIYARALTATQLDASAMAAIERALWRPWLEGLSMYVEMLADPGDDPDQISVVHTAVRSLIDFDIPRRANETDNEYGERYAAEANRQFDGFYGAALKARSRVQHLAYFDDRDGTRRKASDLYVLGYLQVRSVVAAWEATLGRQIVPAVAARLLFTASMVGAFKFYDNLGSIGSMSLAELRERYCSWLRTIAEVPAGRLAEYFAPTGPDQPGTEFIWDEVLRRRDADAGGADRIDEARMNALERDMLGLAHIDTSSGDEATAFHAEMLGLLFKSYLQDNALIPIGTCAAKLLFMTTPGRIGLSVRTYSGHAAPATLNLANPTQHEPRYNYRFWTLPGGDEEGIELRQACGRARTARLSVTRIIDLARRPDLPFGLPGTSYLCGFLGSAFAVVVPWGIGRDVARDHPAFVDLLRDRLMPRFGISDETSTTARPGFLARRALVLDPDNASAASIETLNVEGFALEIARAGVAYAVGVSADAFVSIYDDAMGAPACRRAMARVLHATGRGMPAGDEPDLVGKRFADLVLDRGAFSGVTPLGGKR